MTDKYVQPTFGGLTRPQSAGVGSLKLIPSIGLGLVVVCTVLLSMATSFYLAAGFALLCIVAAAPAVIPYKGRTLYAVWSQGRAWKRHRKTGRNVYMSGLSGVNKTGTRQLPGLLTNVEVWGGIDAADRPFALVQIKATNQWAVTLNVTAQGNSLVDPPTTDEWVAQWGNYLAVLGQEEGISQAAAIVETTPDNGEILLAHTASLLHASGPEFAKRTMMASAEELPRGVAETNGFVALTFTESGLGVDRKIHRGDWAVAQVVAAEIGSRLPALSVGLLDSGASVGIPLTVDELARRVREAYDPKVIAEFAQLDAAGKEVTVSWADAGPSRHDEEATVYHHDSGLSRSWEMSKVPSGMFYDDVLKRILSPIQAAPHKRVALFYYPTDTSAAGTLVDREYKAALARAGRDGVTKASENMAVIAAHQATEEEARGAGVGTISMIVTATWAEGDIEGLKKGTDAIERAAKGARARFSTVRGAQSAHFAASLGVGLSLPDLSIIPTAARDHI